jgi:hypothetical protein
MHKYLIRYSYQIASQNNEGQKLGCTLLHSRSSPCPNENPCCNPSENVSHSCAKKPASHKEGSQLSSLSRSAWSPITRARPTNHPRTCSPLSRASSAFPLTSFSDYPKNLRQQPPSQKIPCSGGGLRKSKNYPYPRENNSSASSTPFSIGTGSEKPAKPKTVNIAQLMEDNHEYSQSLNACGGEASVAGSDVHEVPTIHRPLQGCVFRLTRSPIPISRDREEVMMRRC